MIDGQQPVDYRYLNMDTKQFVPDQEQLLEQIAHNGMLLSTSNEHGQVLIAGGSKHFSQCEAIITCRRLVFRGRLQ